MDADSLCGSCSNEGLIVALPPCAQSPLNPIIDDDAPRDVEAVEGREPAADICEGSRRTEEREEEEERVGVEATGEAAGAGAAERDTPVPRAVKGADAAADQLILNVSTGRIAC